MNYIVIYIVAAIIFMIVMFFSAYFAYKNVFVSKEPVALGKASNSDICYDQICGKYLKLTNLGEVDIP